MASRAEACIRAIGEATKGLLSEDEVQQVFERTNEIEKRLKAEGSIDNLNEKLRDLTAQEADRTVIAAALARKHAALNAIVRDRLNAHVDGMVAAGLSPKNAMLATMEGSQQGVFGARQSVYATRQAFETRYLGGLNAAIAKEKPHIYNLIDDEAFNQDTVREMFELREGGTPGKTGNPDAQWMAKQFSTFAELSRTDLNKLGSAIGKLDGWTGPQIHDDMKIRKVDAKTWVDTIKPLLNYDRTFPDAGGEAEVQKILEDVYTTIVTGRGTGLTPARAGEKVGPASLAKSLGASRVMHFKDAEAWLSYHEQFGGAQLFGSMVSHQQRAASAAAQMTVFGPNPEVMFKSVLDQLQERVRNDPKMAPADKAKEIENLQFQGPGFGNSIANAFGEMQGLTMSPANANMAKIAQTVRQVEAMAKLGGAVWSGVFQDTVTTGMASMFRGSGLIKGLLAQVDGLIHGRPKGEQAEISFLLGEGFDGLIGHAVSPHLANDGVPGAMHKASNTFFKLSGLTWWTDASKATAARTIAAEMGMRAGVKWADLPARYSHVLGLNGITEQKWDAIRSATREAGGKSYVTPDLMRGLSDDVLNPLIADRLADAATKIKDPARLEARRQQLVNDAKLELELDVGRFVGDETAYGILEPDAASRRLMLQGTRPGTAAGEALRFVMQFKGFTFAHSNRVIGRALYGGAGETKGQRMLGNIGHSGAMIAGLGLAGYMSMTVKDALKGKWPPRDPGDPKTWAAAMVQGGGAGVYGDYLFGEANRFGNSPLESIAGPIPAAAANVIALAQRARAGEAKAADGLNLILNNTPFINLWYTRPALDALVLNEVREMASPGYLGRQNQRLRKETGQSYVIPRSLKDLN